MNAHESTTAKPRPAYVRWRGELLAQLALSRLPGIAVTPQPMEGRFDYAVMTSNGSRFLIEVKCLSSFHNRIRRIDTMPELKWRIATSLIRLAHSMSCPVVLFVFDADTEHGRYLRIDNLKLLPTKGNLQRVKLPLENTITEASLDRMLREIGVAYPMEVIGEQGARAIRHGSECIQVDDEDITAMSKMLPAQAWGHLNRAVRPKLSRKEQSILDRWREAQVSLAGICKPPPSSRGKIKRKD
jgi:hypothetical protein